MWFIIVSAVAAANPPKVGELLSATPHEDRKRPFAVGVAILALVLGGAAGLGSQILELLELSDETWRIATGAVAVLAGARHLLAPTRPVPRLGRNVHALVPVVFPVLLVPELLLLMVLLGATEGFQASVVAIVVTVGTLRIWWNSDGGPVTQGTARLLAALLVVVGIGLLVAGIRDV